MDTVCECKVQENVRINSPEGDGKRRLNANYMNSK